VGIGPASIAVRALPAVPGTIGIVAATATETMAVIIALFILIIHNSVTLRFSLLEVLQVVFAVASCAAFELRRKDYIRMRDSRQSSRLNQVLAVFALRTVC
jgi:hypothetical protein